MQHDLEVILVELVEDRFGIGKNFLVEAEFGIVGIPTGRTEAGAEVDHALAGQLLLAEGLGLLEDLFAARQSAVRLVIAEAP